MNVAFAGTPEFAATALRAMVRAGHHVCLVLTQPDRPSGRGLHPRPSAVKVAAREHGIAVMQPAGLRLDGRHAAEAQAARQALMAAAPDVMVVAAYGLILPQWVLDLPRRGALNIHASLLPRWRGAAPIQRAIEAGDAETGITIMQMDAGLDTGAVLLTEATAITPDDCSASLHAKLAAIGARLIVEALGRLERSDLPIRPQPPDGVTYAHKIDKQEAPIDWRQPAPAIERRLRAFDPFPGATFRLVDTVFKAWRGRASTHSTGAPGEIVSTLPGPLIVACGEGCLELIELQRPGGRRQPTRQCFPTGAPAVGTRMALPTD